MPSVSDRAGMPVVFFYGLFMDRDLLKRRGVEAVSPRPARLQGYRPVLGARVTLVPEAGFTTHGMLMRLDPGALERLYSDTGVREYRPEVVRVTLETGESVEALCYNLPRPLAASPPDPAYARQLHALATRLGFPESYLTMLEEGYRPGSGL